ncbi:MAG: aminodeoxychorismate lyase [Flavobacteriaceae bacterium]|nr:aminodeoxychorismate lyase [Flavobacteriaceae bacterium]
MIAKVFKYTSILGLVVCSVLSYGVYRKIFQPNTNFTEDKVEVLIPTNTSAKMLMKILEPHIERSDDFLFVAARKKYFSNIKAGRFILQKGLNNNQIVNTLRSKNNPIKITFNNLDYLEDFASFMGNKLECDSLQIIETFKSKAKTNKLELTYEQMMSILIPNTYEFYWNTSSEQLWTKMSNEYLKFWTESRRNKAKKLKLSFAEVYALASIVDKESLKREEQPIIAGVYLNRLKRGIKLQADPTVIYSIRESLNDRDTIIKRVLYKDLTIDSPYNTYRYKGIPPRPIGMPDVFAIDAVLNAGKHNYFYFVADIENPGYHDFSKTLREHNRKSRKYSKWLNKNKIYR